MVEKGHWRMLPAKERSGYKFQFCEDCPLYECELVGEYEQFKKAHRKALGPVIGWTSDGNPVVKGRIAHTTVQPQEVHAATNSSLNVDVETLSYGSDKQKAGCFMRQKVRPIECGRRTVTEGIGDHFKIEVGYDGKIQTKTEDRWEPWQPVFISAQTGQGKNYFIENTLIPYVRELNYRNKTNHRVLILSNRLALKQQIKNRLNGYDDADDTEGHIYHYKDCADVMTYQSLLQQEKYLKNRKKGQLRYLYVICDEAHFFTSDAMFNPHTSRILSTIVRLFKDAIRVYMSATPYECLEYITKAEDNLMVFYHFKRDYSYLDVKTYSDFSELFEIIAKSVRQDKKRWLIFIDDKQRCADTKRQLEGYGEEHGCPLIIVDKDDVKTEMVLAVNASSKKDETYMEMVKSEKLDKDTYVLITTSVLDNGVNLRNIDNIVVSDMSKVKCLQMAGRARVKVDDPKDRKTLYIKRFGDGEVEKQITALKQQEDAYHRYELAYGELHPSVESRGQNEYNFLNRYYDGDVKDWLNAKCWFGRPMYNPRTHEKPTALYLNEIAKSLVDRYIQQYKAIYDEMLKESDVLTESQCAERVDYTGQTYLEYQLSWFGKTYCEDDDITFADRDKAKKALVAFLESYVISGEHIAGEDRKTEFRAEFTKLQDAAFGRKDPNKDRYYGIRKMNAILAAEDVGYKVVSESSVWIIQKYDWAAEDE